MDLSTTLPLLFPGSGERLGPPVTPMMNDFRAMPKYPV